MFTVRLLAAQLLKYNRQPVFLVRLEAIVALFMHVSFCYLKILYDGSAEPKLVEVWFQ